MPKAKQKSFEESLARLDEIINEIEDGAALENSVKLYKEGISLSVSLNETLSKYENEVAQLVESSEGRFEERPFLPERQTGDDKLA